MCVARLSSGGPHSPGGGKPCSDPHPSLDHSFTRHQPRGHSELPDMTAPLYFPVSPLFTELSAYFPSPWAPLEIPRASDKPRGMSGGVGTAHPAALGPAWWSCSLQHPRPPAQAVSADGAASLGCSQTPCPDPASADARSLEQCVVVLVCGLGSRTRPWGGEGAGFCIFFSSRWGRRSLSV